MNPISSLDPEAIYATLADLVSINSVNPNYPGGPGEGALAEYVAQFLQENSIPYEIQPIGTGRPNVIARLEGRPGGRTLILEAHLDTASELGMEIPPFDPARKDGRMYGRGSCDIKGGLAAMMHALKAAHESSPPPNATVILVAAADEEYSFRGIVKFLEKGWHAHGAVVAEPTQLEIAVASKAAFRFRLRIAGRAAHSSKPHLGINAIVKMAKLIMAMEETFPPLFEKRRHPMVGCPTINVGIIKGGTQSNQVPDSCTIDVDRRMVPGETTSQVKQELTALSSSMKTRDPEFNVAMEQTIPDDYPLETAPSERVVQLANKVSQELGAPARLVAVPYSSDAGKLSHAAIPSIIMGPGNIDQAHAATEYVELEQVALAARAYYQLIMEF
ncbi:MAG: M20 family metallopeptidase [Candidatus Omnitrophica bacterium]|nr:M20 family metallopeptidase [Candidatus Omnitrophota bacterium]